VVTKVVTGAGRGGVFTVSGVTREGHAASVSWYPPGERRGVRGERRGLVGDGDTVAVALAAEALGERVDATATGPSLRVDLDDPVATVVLVGSLFLDGYRIDGDPPRVEYRGPKGAIP
jgi:hypothetical protein